MPNLYGVSNPVIIPVVMTIPSGSVNLVAGVETNVTNPQPLAAISSGVYYPQIFGSMGGVATAAGATGFIVSAHIGAGADFLSLSFSPQQFTNGTFFTLPIVLVGPASEIPWKGAGSTVTVSVNMQGATGIIYGGSTYLWATLYRAPDQ